MKPFLLNITGPEKPGFFLFLLIHMDPSLNLTEIFFSISNPGPNLNTIPVSRIKVRNLNQLKKEGPLRRSDIGFPKVGKVRNNINISINS
jgi:hypothetical protein